MTTYSATIYVFSSDNNATKKETKKCENPVVTCKEWLAGQKQIRTRTAWAVFKYCGTKTVTLRMRKKI
jgi:hypothetical protein